QNYLWSWTAFISAGASGFFMFLYLVVHFFIYSDFSGFPSMAIWFGWSFVMSLLFAILTGTVGYFACLVFLRKVFASIKVD
ncbi:hypothetical protein BDK51DRAFT_21330, partial [Blyttiomyces helicus]